MLAGALLFSGNMLVRADTDELPVRTSPRPATTSGIPHVQIGITTKPELTKELLRRVATIPDIEIRETVISLPGAKGFWLNDDLQLVRPEIIIGGREFAHMHPDGSLHASLPTPLAIEAIEKGWAVHHPWSKWRPGWDGFVMVYSAESTAELDVVVELVRRSYNYITGRNHEMP